MYDSNYYLISQIDSEGNETDYNKLTEGVKSAVEFISPGGDQKEQTSIQNTLIRMAPGDFTTLFVDGFNYEIDCLSPDQVKELEFDSTDLIPKKITVYEIFTSENDLSYAYGEQDLRNKLSSEFGFSDSDIETAVRELNASQQAELTREDPEYYSVAVDQLSDQAVTKLSATNPAFKLDYEVASKMPLSETAEAIKPIIHFDYSIEIIPEDDGKFGFKIMKQDEVMHEESGFDSSMSAIGVAQFAIDSGAIAKPELNESASLSQMKVSDEAVDAIKKVIAAEPFIAHNSMWGSDDVLFFHEGDAHAEDDFRQVLIDLLTENGFVEGKDFTFDSTLSEASAEPWVSVLVKVNGAPHTLYRGEWVPAKLKDGRICLHTDDYAASFPISVTEHLSELFPKNKVYLVDGAPETVDWFELK